MKILDILKIESDNDSDIHVVRDRTFWACYERSAHRFQHFFKKYKINRKFIQKANQDIVWLGFPESSRQFFINLSNAKGYSVYYITDDHFVIKGVPTLGGFDDWKNNLVRSSSIIPKESEIKNSEFHTYKLAYDFSLHVLRAISKFNRAYKFSLGQRINDTMTSIMSDIHLHINSLSELNIKTIKCEIMDLRLYFRMAKDLNQIKEKQWLFINSNLEGILESLSSESSC